jgi:uncharacterized protein YajQ (UPF0234 family)
MGNEIVFTKGFNRVDVMNPLLLASKDYIKRFEGKGYYIFVEINEPQEYEISGKFNHKVDLVFSRATSYLFQTEVSTESIEMGENRYQIILKTKNKTKSILIERTVLLSLELN